MSVLSSSQKTIFFRPGIFFIHSNIQLIKSRMNGIGRIFPAKLIKKPLIVFICSKTIAVNIPSLHSSTGITEIKNTTSSSGIPCDVKNS